MSFYLERLLYIFVGLANLALVAPPASAQTVTETPATKVLATKAVATAAKTKATTAVEGYEFTFPALGTLVQLKTFSDDQALVEQAFAAAEKEVQRLQGVLSDYDPESETRQLTTAAFQRPTEVSRDMWQVLTASEAWHQRTEGAFDASLGSLTRLWRQGRRAGKIPDRTAIQQALDDCGWQHVRLDKERQTVELLMEGIHFDFGAIGKGYIVDRIFELLVERGLTTTLVNISGNMRCGNPPPNRAGWRIAISPLEKDGEAIRKVEIHHCAIATSGDLWQFSEIDGVRRSHVLDPRTGVGVPGPLSATVIAPQAADADALATAACILEFKRATELVDTLQSTELLVARENSEGEVAIQESSGFPKPTR